MTHDELLTRLTEGKHDYEYSLRKALLSVVELHKALPWDNGEGESGFNCFLCQNNYPCQTIQAIEERFE
jgi:hypothetical protein